tara:strand:- start:2674 stop:3417 length:744 start_codon:yes stop_codon:yes gene_type:complete
MKLSKSDLKKYSRQIILKKIGVLGQEKIIKSKVLIVGLGGLGCPLLIYLANSGVGKIGIVDDDKIEISNLNRQILFNASDIGKFKVNQAKKFINKINNNIKIKKFNTKINSQNIYKIFKNFDIICDGTDNFKTRYLINDHCLKMKKILVSAAISKFGGHLFKFNFKKKTPCFRCFAPEFPNYVNDCEYNGILPSVAGIMGSMQASEVINSILKPNQGMSSEMIIFDSLKMNFRKVKLNINKNCTNKC